MAEISNFTSKGTRVSGSRGSGPLASLGREIDGKVYQHPRIRKDGGIGGSGSVRVTNPSASPVSTQRRSASLGMGGIEQYRRY